jgi:hypothetical protein
LLIARGADTAAAGIKANPMVAIAALLNKLRRPIAVVHFLENHVDTIPQQAGA